MCVCVYIYIIYILSRHGLSLVPSRVGQCKGEVKTGKTGRFIQSNKKNKKVHSSTKSVPGEKRVPENKNVSLSKVRLTKSSSCSFSWACLHPGGPSTPGLSSSSLLLLSPLSPLKLPSPASISCPKHLQLGEW